MTCQTVQEQLGAYLDGELPPDQASQVRQHVEACADCASQLERLRELIERLPWAGESKAPENLWSSIEHRLDRSAANRTRRMLRHWLRRPVAAAASIALLIAAGVFVTAWLTSGTTTARATTINFGVLLDGLTANADDAVAGFLRYYHAESIPTGAAHAVAPRMSFAVPAELPGGFRLEQVYRLRLRSDVAIAARYRRGQEPLAVFFHPPVDKEQMGVHAETHCLVGGRHAHSVEVGPWRLVHFTDPTTCHCVLSRLDMQSELPAVMTAVAPAFTGEPTDGRQRP